MPRINPTSHSREAHLDVQNTGLEGTTPATSSASSSRLDRPSGMPSARPHYGASSPSARRASLSYQSLPYRQVTHPALPFARSVPSEAPSRQADNGSLAYGMGLEGARLFGLHRASVDYLHFIAQTNTAVSSASVRAFEDLKDVRHEVDRFMAPLAQMDASVL